MKHKRLLESNQLPTLTACIGVAFGVVSALFAYSERPAAGAVLGVITAIFAILLTLIIALRQFKESDELKTTIGNMNMAVSDIEAGNATQRDLTLKISEQLSEIDYSSTPNEGVGDEYIEDTDRPEYSNEAIGILSKIGSRITEDTAIWKKKIPAIPTSGNHGWFVESMDPNNSERWYVRKGRGWTVRRAMPRELLDAFERDAQVNPKEIKLDFQQKEHGLASWYARTYSGDLWRIWKSNRNQGKGIQVERVDTVDK